MALECASCRTQNRDGAKFCKGCGHRLVAVAGVANDGVAPAGWPITDRMPLPPAMERSSAAADETTVAIGRSPAPPSRVPTRPATLPPSPPPVRAPNMASRPAALSAPMRPRRSRALWGGLALLLVALAAGAGYMQSRRDAVTPAVSQTPAAAGPIATAPPAPAPVEAPAAPVRVSSPAPIPESPPPAPAEVPGPAPQPTAIAEPPAAASPSVKAEARTKPAPPPASKPAPAPAPRTAVAAALKPRKAPPAAPTPAPQPAPTPGAVVAAAPAEPVAPPSPDAACAGQGFFGRSRCMVAQCAKPELRASAQCEAVRRQQQIDEEKRNPSLAN
jgi:hypothetical protein